MSKHLSFKIINVGLYNPFLNCSNKFSDGIIYAMKTNITIFKRALTFLAIIQFMGVSACTTGIIATEDPISGTQTAQALLPTATITPTPIPMAFTIDGDGYLQSSFERELQRYTNVKENSGQNDVAENPETYVLEKLIDQQLLLRAAIQNGCTVSEDDIQQQWDQLVAQLPEGQSMDDWLTSRDYTADEFRAAINDTLLETCQIKQVTDGAPYEAEQIHAVQILVSDPNLANAIHAQLDSGAEFATLAYEYDSITGGDLGWFPQGYLLQPAVDEAVFALQPGQYTAVIESEVGYHIVYVVAREMHPLSLEARKVLQKQALDAWLQTERAQSQIVTMIAK